MKVLVGTSGFSYDEWRGSFYPDKIAKDQMLTHYAARLPSVEVNNTFYRMPNAAVLAGWSAATGPEFQFALKSSRRITHIGKLKDVSDSVSHMVEVFSVIGDKLGAVLFQLPPYLRRDDALLLDFLALLPPGYPAALEPRHPSWFHDGVYATLRERNVALVSGDAEEGDKSPPFVVTADFGYLRLRADAYDAASIARWAERIADSSWQRAFAYFKHERLGPSYALALMQRSAGALGPGLAKAPLAASASGSTPDAAPAPPARPHPGVAATRTRSGGGSRRRKKVAR